MEDVEDYVLINTQVSKKLLKMWNNVKYSDTKFLVNQTQFHASSHLVTVSSDALEYLVDNHYENCNDREITIPSVKHAESFANILRYIYGLEINFTQMSKAVMCEVLHLSDTYELPEFSKELKSFLGKLDSFQVDSAVVLLNTAKKFHLDELYEKLTVFAYKNTEQLVKHESFKQLQFDVLRDLLKSDFFCAPEINILTGVLVWHNDMNEGPRREIFNKEEESESVAEDTDVSDCETDLDELVETESGDENEDNNSANEDCADSSSQMAHGNIVGIESKYSVQADKCAELVQTFSQNVLKSLLSHIRITLISVFDYMEAYTLFKYQKNILANKKHFSSNIEPRKRYDTSNSINDKVQPSNISPEVPQRPPVSVAVASVATQVPPVSTSTSSPVSDVLSSVAGVSTAHPASANQQPVGNILEDPGQVVELSSSSIPAPPRADNYCVKKTFTVQTSECKNWLESVEEHTFSNKKWKMYLRVRDNKTIDINLHCKSHELLWETTVQCNFTLKISPIYRYNGKSLCLPSNGSFKSITLTSQQPCVYFGEFKSGSSCDMSHYNYNSPFTVEAHFHAEVN